MDQNTPYTSYTKKQLISAYTNSGVSGLSNLGLSDSDIILALRRYCIGINKPDGRDSIVRVLKYDAVWDKDRFMRAETDFGVDAKSLEMLAQEFDRT